MASNMKISGYLYTSYTQKTQGACSWWMFTHLIWKWVSTHQNKVWNTSQPAMMMSPKMEKLQTTHTHSNSGHLGMSKIFQITATIKSTTLKMALSSSNQNNDTVCVHDHTNNFCIFKCVGSKL